MVRNGAIQIAVPDAHLLFHQTGFSDAKLADCVDLYLRALAAHAQPGMALERAWERGECDVQMRRSVYACQGRSMTKALSLLPSKSRKYAA